MRQLFIVFSIVFLGIGITETAHAKRYVHIKSISHSIVNEGGENFFQGEIVASTSLDRKKKRGKKMYKARFRLVFHNILTDETYEVANTGRKRLRKRDKVITFREKIGLPSGTYTVGGVVLTSRKKRGHVFSTLVNTDLENSFTDSYLVTNDEFLPIIIGK